MIIKSGRGHHEALLSGMAARSQIIPLKPLLLFVHGFVSFGWGVNINSRKWKDERAVLTKRKTQAALLLIIPHRA